MSTLMQDAEIEIPNLKGYDGPPTWSLSGESGEDVEVEAWSGQDALSKAPDSLNVDMILLLPPTLHVSRYETPAGAAKALYRHLRVLAESRGQDPDIEVVLKRPSEHRFNGWGVFWEAGPFDWAVDCSKVKVQNADGHGIAEGPGWIAEAGYSCSLNVIDW